jgi:hypothetical protein
VEKVLSPSLLKKFAGGTTHLGVRDALKSKGIGSSIHLDQNSLEDLTEAINNNKNPMLLVQNPRTNGTYRAYWISTWGCNEKGFFVYDPGFEQD